MNGSCLLYSSGCCKNMHKCLFDFHQWNKRKKSLLLFLMAPTALGRHYTWKLARLLEVAPTAYYYKHRVHCMNKCNRRIGKQPSKAT